MLDGMERQGMTGNKEHFLANFPRVLEKEMRYWFDPSALSIIIREKPDSVYWSMRWTASNDFIIKGKIYDFAIKDLAILMDDYVQEFVRDILRNAVDAMNKKAGKVKWVIDG